MNIKFLVAVCLLTVTLLFTFDVIKLPTNFTNKPTTTLIPTTTAIVPISMKVPFLDKPGYKFIQRFNVKNELNFDDSENYFAKIFNAPETGIISGIVLKAKPTPTIQNPSFVISTRSNAPEYPTTIIENTSNNIILYCDILDFKQKFNIPDSVVNVNKDTPIFLLKNNIIYTGTFSNIQIDVYYNFERI